MTPGETRNPCLKSELTNRANPGPSPATSSRPYLPSVCLTPLPKTLVGDTCFQEHSLLMGRPTWGRDILPCPTGTVIDRRSHSSSVLINDSWIPSVCNTAERFHQQGEGCDFPKRVVGFHARVDGSSHAIVSTSSCSVAAGELKRSICSGAAAKRKQGPVTKVIRLQPLESNFEVRKSSFHGWKHDCSPCEGVVAYGGIATLGSNPVTIPRPGQGRSRVLGLLDELPGTLSTAQASCEEPQHPLDPQSQAFHPCWSQISN